MEIAKTKDSQHVYTFSKVPISCENYGYKIIARTRRGGKTHEIVKRMKGDPNGVLVVANRTTALNISTLYDIPMSKIFIIHHIIFDGHLRGRGKRFNIYIDNLDLCMDNLINNEGCTLKCSTVTI